MKYSFILALICLPALAVADDFSGYMNAMIERAQAGSGTVIIENHSSVSTGGQVAGAGQSVVTDGDVSASSHVETHINTGESGGSVQIKVETSRNGEKKTEEYKNTIDPDEPVYVRTDAKVDSEEGAQIDAEVNGEAVIDSENGTTSAEVGSNIEIKSRFEKAFDAMPGFFKKVLSFFWGW